MPLSPLKRKHLKAQAHALAPVIITGNKGITENLLLETDRALATHELIKIRINALDREELTMMAQEICTKCQAELVHIIGHIAIVYRKRPAEPVKSKTIKTKKKPTRKTKH